VSAYALFFRDTQAAIKGQNPNASFGEVSKIVASMWDALDVEHKNVSDNKQKKFQVGYSFWFSSAGVQEKDRAGQEGLPEGVGSLQGDSRLKGRN